MANATESSQAHYRCISKELEEFAAVNASHCILVDSRLKDDPNVPLCESCFITFFTLEPAGSVRVQCGFEGQVNLIWEIHCGGLCTDK